VLPVRFEWRIFALSIGISKLRLIVECRAGRREDQQVPGRKEKRHLFPSAVRRWKATTRRHSEERCG
jgi:hypothetical protein